MENERVQEFLLKAESRSKEDLVSAITSISMALTEIKAALDCMKLQPYIHVTAKTPEIKLPDIHRKETFIVNVPTGLIFTAMVAPYIILLGAFAILKFYPLVSRVVYGN
jgi:hypothetical protein